MVRYLYFDIETTGFESHHFITLINIYDIYSMKQWLYRQWDSNEHDMLKRVMHDHPHLIEEGFSDATDILVGSNVLFDLCFFCNRLRNSHLKIKLPDVIRKAKIDTQGLQIIANDMLFKGSGINSFTGKKGTGQDAVNYYNTKQYDKLVEYSINERICFVDWLFWLGANFPKFMKGYPYAKVSSISATK